MPESACARSDRGDGFQVWLLQLDDAQYRHAAALAAAALLIPEKPINFGLDLSGGVQLIYEVDIDRAKEEKIRLKNLGKVA